MKEEVKKLIEYLWYNELASYREFLLNKYKMSLLEEFEAINLENKLQIKKWLKNHIEDDHVFITLLKLNLKYQ